MEEQEAGIPPVETGSGVETISQEAPLEKTAADLLAEKDAELASLTVERDNYRRAVKKRGLTVEEEPEEDDSLDAIIDRKVEEKLFDRRAAQIQQEKEALLQKTIKENEEMRNALRNRAGTPTSSGSNLDKAPGKTESYWSPSQVKELESKGLDPKQVWENLQKSDGTRGAPTA